MANQYIERETAKSELLSWAACMNHPEYLMRDDALHVIDSIPAADVAPVRHGRWIEPKRLYYGAKQYECSICYSDTFWKKHSITEKYPHCPNCGVRMDGGEV